MPNDDRHKSFTADLAQLADVADKSLPMLHKLFQSQVSGHDKFEGVSPPTMSPGIDSAFYSMNGILRERMKKASEAIDETRQALHDIVHLYKRADGQA